MHSDLIAKLEALDFDPDSDELDGVLFRFWIRAASWPGGWPMDLLRAIKDCKTPAEYRCALIQLAETKRVNLPLKALEARDG